MTWHVQIGDDLSMVERVCRADGAAVNVVTDAIAPVDPRARSYASPVVVVDGCFEFSLSLRQAAEGLRARSSAVVAGPDVVIASPDVWLWSPSPPRRGTLELTSPSTATSRTAGAQVRPRWAVPFPVMEPTATEASSTTAPTTTTAARMVADGQVVSALYEVDPSTWRFLSASAFGDVDVRQVVAPGAALQVVTLPGSLHMVDAEVDRWLTTAATAVSFGAGRSGRFPFERALVMVEPVWGRGVPFGMVCRGGGAQALLLLGQGGSLDDVLDGWVAVHELAHLLHPLVGQDEAWFGEGFASYHQNILRSRAGLLDETVAWRELADGFRRGDAAAGRGPWTLSLREASARMRADGRYLQTYWGGAAIILWMDVALRRCGGGTIDDVVATFRAEQPRLDARRIPAASIIDRAASSAPGCAHIKPDVEAFLEEPFPSAWPSLLTDLGVVDGGPLDDRAPLAAVREAIAHPVRRLR